MTELSSLSAVIIVVLLIALAALLITLVQLYRAREALNELSAQAYRARLEITRLTHQLQHAEVVRQTLFEHPFDAIVLLDEGQRLIACNGRAKTLGLEQLGASLIETTRSHELDALVADALAGREWLTRNVTLNERLYRAHAVRARDVVVLFLHDISELQRLGRARRDFVANISHELRTPLSALRLLVDSLALEIKHPPAEVQRTLDQINTQLALLTQLVQELSDLSQIESGQMPMRMVRASLREVVQAVFERLEPQAARAQLALINEVPEEAYGLFDPVQIQRVLTNLVHNAIKFTPQGSVTVFIGTPEETAARLRMLAQRLPDVQLPPSEEVLLVGVRDTGVGIPKEELTRIFERFYKVDRARGKGGTGLGLSIAKHIVEAHGGQIWSESELGKGATFYFTLLREN